MNFANFLKISEKKSSLNASELVFQRFRVLDYPPKKLFRKYRREITKKWKRKWEDYANNLHILGKH